MEGEDEKERVEENNLMDPKRITFLGNIVFGSLENDFEWVGERDFFL